VKRIEQEKANQLSSDVAPELENNIRRRAYEIYEERRGIGGSEVEDWLQAESEVLDKKKNVARAA